MTRIDAIYNGLCRKAGQPEMMRGQPVPTEPLAKDGRIVMPDAPALSRTGTPDAPVLSRMAGEAARIYDSISASYFALRIGAALLSIALPLVLLFLDGLATGRAGSIQPSLSDYYHFTDASRNIFVGALCVIGAVLMIYRGYAQSENMALNIAGVALVCVAQFPIDNPADGPVSITQLLHFVSATLFFILIAYVAIFEHHRTLQLLDDAGQRRRFARLYISLGALMVAAPLGVAAFFIMLPDRANSPLIFWVEAAGTFVFAGYWLVKSGEIRLIEAQSSAGA